MAETLEAPQKPISKVRQAIHHRVDQVYRLFSGLPEILHDGTGARLPTNEPTITTTPPATDVTDTTVSPRHSSVSAPATTNNTTVASLPDTDLAPQCSETHFRESSTFPKVRGAPIYAYPHSSSLISAKHHQRFRDLVDIFKRKVESEAKLKPHVKLIHYTMRLCGRSPKESHPSIIVICVDEIFRDLRKVFEKPDLKTQYAVLDVKWARNRRGHAEQYMAAINIPRFHLHFWIGPAPMTLLWRPAIAGGVQIQKSKDMETSGPCWSDLTMCGSRIITFDGSCSTLACLVDIDSETHGLTVAHAFSHLVPRHPDRGQSQQDICEPSEPYELPGEVCFEDDAFFEDDVEYDISEDDTMSDHAPAAVPDLETDKVEEDLLLEQQKRFSDSALLIMEPTSPDTPDLDWALVKMSDEQSEKPNFYLTANDVPKPILLRSVAQHHPGHEREVLIIRTLQGPCPGTLLGGSSFIGGINRPGQCEVWNIQFTGDHGLIKGDSGSLVVDRQTSEVYGFVVGLNLLGEAYVMPMVTTLAQIKESLRADNVMLPNPCSLVRNMTRNPALTSAFSLLLFDLQQALDDFESTNCTAEAAPIGLESKRTSPPPGALKAAMGGASSHPLLIEDTTPSSLSYGYQPPPESNLVRSRFKRQEEILAFVEPEPNQWEPCIWDLDIIMQEQGDNVVVFAGNDFDMNQYRHYFNEMFLSCVDQDINGAFHCGYTVAETGTITPRVSWSCFKIKQVRNAHKYHWNQPCIHVDWDCKTGRQIVFVFNFLDSYTIRDDAQAFLDRVWDSQARMLNPFVWHWIFARNIYDQYNNAMWSLRDLVREQEKRRNQTENKKTTFPQLHDLARHCSHYSETIEVAEHTLNALVVEHEKWRREDDRNVRHALDAWLKSQQGLLFEARRAYSLRMASKTLHARLLNEINMASNLISHESGQAASVSTTMIKSVAFITIIYLPGIYVSGIFGTNFFSSQSNDRFTVSSEFWIFWAATVPLTILTLFVWWTWHNQGRLHAYFGRIYETTTAADALPGSTLETTMHGANTGLPGSVASYYSRGQNDSQPWRRNLVGYLRGKTEIVRKPVRKQENV